ncbi:MAG: hypoxanthine-guanine phosphoribosyltransferase [Thiohalomonadaceae bacterium]
MPITPEHALAVYRSADCLATEAQVNEALARMAREIGERLADSNPLVLVVLTGALVPAGCLLPMLDFPLELDYVHATRYAGATAGGELFWIAHPRTSMTGRSVLIIDDILDEGPTLKAIIEHCRAEGATEVLSAVLVEKRHDRKNGLKADFVGLEVDDRYVFGFGMDYKGYWRNAPGIYAVKED